MNKETRPLNDTLSLKREIRSYGFAKPFWDGTRDKKVVIQYCKSAKKFQHFPRPTSIFTGRMGDVEWREISGKGEIFSYTVTYRGTDRFRAVEPYAVACVTFEGAGEAGPPPDMSPARAYVAGSSFFDPACYPKLS
jgi:uncharacterized OB-fold protein